MDLVEDKTRKKAGLPCVLNGHQILTKDDNYSETTFDEQFWNIEVCSTLVLTIVLRLYSSIKHKLLFRAMIWIFWDSRPSFEDLNEDLQRKYDLSF